MVIILGFCVVGQVYLLPVLVWFAVNFLCERSDVTWRVILVCYCWWGTLCGFGSKCELLWVEIM